MPVAAIYSTFLQRAIDSAIHDIALQNLDVVIAVDRAGLVGADGPTHHGLFDIPLLRSVPNVSIAAPSSADELEEMLEAAILQPGLKLLRYPRGAALRDESPQKLAWGKARALTTVGGSLALWTLGTAVSWAREAMALLSEEQRRQITLIDARFVKPIDAEMLERSLTNAKSLVTIEDGSIAGGFGSAVVEEAIGRGLILPKNIKLLGVPDRWVAHGEVSEQRAELGLSPEQLALTIREQLK